MDAIDDLSDALETTRNVLTPVSLGFWLKLAVVVFFVSSLGLGGPMLPGGDVGAILEEPTAGEQGGEELEALEEDVPVDEILLALAILLVIGLVLWLVYAFIAAIMEFVFIETLRSSELNLRSYFGANLGNGVRLFLFRIGVLLAMGVLAVGPALLLEVTGTGLEAASGGTFGIYLLYGIAVYLGYSIVQRFTSEFVAPIMLLEDRGVLSAWGRLWPTVTSNVSEYLVYLILVWILSFAISLGVWFLISFGILALMIPFVIGFVLLAFLGEIGFVLMLPLGVLAFVSVLLFVALVWTPITTYFQYYALLVLGDTNDELDLIPDQRNAVRSGNGPQTPRDGTASRGDTQSGDGAWGRDSSGSDEGSLWDDTDDSDPWGEPDDGDGTGDTDDGPSWDDAGGDDDRDRTGTEDESTDRDDDTRGW
ncbi:DUF7544 domain-containing protein [Natronorubrum daqingense]|uniref:Uncharacterized protein n=1 Tax=Natronorubrum daqingense TaxID=588898 RepID=A0A1N6YPQ8_9EURY|nr:DUF4013 domain-containing protein [Natronorubrum daqingense]APX95597.1 hypothetical protein BB347_02630 [Natronorubrum daqingense]SIR16628.1 hypothetical protein SAMN05421809_0519 [Natronorubrum daqingense]